MPPYKIVLLGPESTAKTTLARQLAKYYKTKWLPEYGRQYLININRPYNYEDVVFIAKMQYLREILYSKKSQNFLFVDTDLINIEVWFEIVYNKKPKWLPKKMSEIFADFYLLCKPDIEWQPDTVRENGGKMRNYLFEIYKNKLIEYQLNFAIISGKGNIRFKNCVNEIRKNNKKNKL